MAQRGERTRGRARARRWREWQHAAATLAGLQACDCRPCLRAERHLARRQRSHRYSTPAEAHRAEVALRRVGTVGWWAAQMTQLAEVSR
jgi:hypothetical protein